MIRHDYRYVVTTDTPNPWVVAQLGLGEARATADLIAAAPDLLVALENLVGMHDRWDAEPDEDPKMVGYGPAVDERVILKRARVAIAKARGEVAADA